MSISSNAVLMVGLPHEELVAFLGDEEVERILNECELVSGSYHYDSSPTENIIGYCALGTSRYVAIENSEIRDILSYMEEFETAYGLKPQVFLTLSIT